jgi:mono/diheme cytochrome c family protein
MKRLPTPIRLLLTFAALVAVVAAVSGCGTSTGDKTRGRQLFTADCGTCHTLAQAGSAGVQGPNLDDAFASAREVGMNAATIEGIVKAQVESPRPENGDPAVSMPRHIVEGQDLDDVAAYIGSVAGVPGIKPPEVEGGAGAQVFANNGCGGCHTLAAAKSSGTTGPNLDEVLPGQSEEMITESVVNPEAEIAKGYPAGVMPQEFGTKLSEEELKQLVEYLSESTSKGK